jgi:thiol-disulfide isomerase/thioredoxin
MKILPFYFLITFFLIKKTIYGQVTVVHDKKYIITKADLFGHLIKANIVSKSDTNENKVISTFNEDGFFKFVDTQFSIYHSFGFYGNHNDTITIESNGTIVELNSKNHFRNEKKDLPFIKSLDLSSRRESPQAVILDFENSFIRSKETYLNFLDYVRNHQYQFSKIYKEQLLVGNNLCRLQFLLSPYNRCSPDIRFTPNSKDSTIYFAEIERLFGCVREMDKKGIQFNAQWLNFIIENYINFKTRYFVGDPNLASKKLEFVLNDFKGWLLEAALTKLLLAEGVMNPFFTKNKKTFFQNIIDPYFRRLIEIEMLKLTNLSQSSLGLTKLNKLNSTDVTFNEFLKLNTGKLLYIDIWASWCAGCKVAIPKIVSFFNSKRIPIVFLSIDSSLGTWKKSTNNWPFPFQSSHYRLNPESELAAILTPPSIPRGLLVNTKGDVYGIFNGDINDSSLLQALKEIE